MFSVSNFDVSGKIKVHYNKGLLAVVIIITIVIIWLLEILYKTKTSIKGQLSAISQIKLRIHLGFYLNTLIGGNLFLANDASNVIVFINN